MATYVNDLRLKEIGTGESSGTWGSETNVNLELIGEALGFGTEGITTNADTHTTTVADGSTDPGRAMYLKYTGTLDSACTITIAPNTMSRMQFIENGTSGSQNIIISQGTGANVTIPAGDTKAVYLDGAGSGAAVVDAFASLSTVDLKVQDDLTVTDDLIVGGDIDLEGAIDVNGTANLDVVDIDGAVDMASTLQVDGAITNSSTIVSAGKITADAGIDIDNFNIDGTTIALSSGSMTLDAASQIVLDADGGLIQLKDGGTEFAQLKNDSTDLQIISIAQDKDIIFRGNDGSSFINALQLDMSAAGRAVFNAGANFSDHVNFNDNAKAIFGGGDDLQIYHDASDSYIQDTGTGNLLIQYSDLFFSKDAGTSHMVRFHNSGDVTIGTTSASSAKLAVSGDVRVLNDGKLMLRKTDTFMQSPSDDIMAFTTGGGERMRIDSSGNVMIGITSSSHKFMVNQATVNEIGAFFYNNTSTNEACVKILQDGAGSSGPALVVRQDGSGNAITVDDGSDGNTVFSVSQNGGLSKASGSFKINHPLEAKKDTHHLVHSFVEAPQADNIYRGTATLSSGTATINLDTVSGMTEGTYVLLNTNTSCFTSNETDWDAVKGSVSGNTLTITCQNDSSTATVSWLVIGERHDQHMKDTEWTDDNGKVIVEPLKEG